MTDWHQFYEAKIVPKPKSPSECHEVNLVVDYGSGSYETTGRMYRIDDDGEPMLVFADAGGWCTPHVTKWKFSK